MSRRFDLLVRGGTCVGLDGLAPADVGVIGTKIAAIGDLADASAAEVVEARGLHVLPGVIDSQVHFREPGHEHKEDLATGTRAAVLGGVTAVFEMPNTSPTTTDAAALNDKLTRAKGRVHCDVAFFVGASGDNADRLGELERLPGCVGVKIFMGSSTGTLLVEDDSGLERALRSGTRRVAIHAEDEARLRERKALLGADEHPRRHPFWRDEQTAILATQRALAASSKTGRRIHVLHVTTAEEMELLAAHKARVTVEVTPQHLTLAAPDCYDRLGTFAQMNPPIRDERHRAGLWQAVRAGVVDVIGSDHAPHTREEKAKPYPASPSGMPGVQTMLPLMLEHVHAGRLGLLRLVDLLCAGPCRIYGVQGKGRLAVGYDADLTLVDLGAERVIEEAKMATRCGWTPFAGMKVHGWPEATIVRGHVVMRHGELLGTPIGEPVRFLGY